MRSSQQPPIEHHKDFWRIAPVLYDGREQSIEWSDTTLDNDHRRTLPGWNELLRNRHWSVPDFPAYTSTFLALRRHTSQPFVREFLIALREDFLRGVILSTGLLDPGKPDERIVHRFGHRLERVVDIDPADEYAWYAALYGASQTSVDQAYAACIGRIPALYVDDERYNPTLEYLQLRNDGKDALGMHLSGFQKARVRGFRITNA